MQISMPQPLPKYQDIAGLSNLKMKIAMAVSYKFMLPILIRDLDSREPMTYNPLMHRDPLGPMGKSGDVQGQIRIG